MCMYKNVHAEVQGYLRIYAYTSMYYAIGDRTYVHIIYMCKYVCVRMHIIICTNMCTYVCTCVRDHTSVRYAICVRTYVRTY